MDIEEILSALREIRREQREQRQEQDSLARLLSRLVGRLEQDDELQERAEVADRQERADHHAVLLRQLSDLAGRVDSAERAVRGIPKKTLSEVEQEIYKLRTARWEASQPLSSNEPMPLPPAPRGDSTGRYVLPAAHPEPAKEDESLAPTAAQWRGIGKVVKGILSHRLTHGGGLLLAWEAIKHLPSWVAHLIAH